MNRAEVEEAIRDEELVLKSIVELLESGTQLAAWPVPLRDALGLAISEEAVSGAEHWKLVALRRHLFGSTGNPPAELAPPPAPSKTDRRRAERVRAELTACVRYRAGVALIPPSAT